VDPVLEGPDRPHLPIGVDQLLAAELHGRLPVSFRAVFRAVLAAP
jgi:hypothetical protein